MEFKTHIYQRCLVKPPPKISILIRKKICMILYIYLLTGCTTIAAAFLNMDNIYYPITLLKETEHYISMPLYYLHKVSFILSPIAGISYAACFFLLSTYMVQEVDYIKQICDSFPTHEEAVCQKAIKNKLIELIKIHIQLKL